ncbi:hypothetical protein VTI74DRAFT_7634 [Chaetomium olivicolor]
MSAKRVTVDAVLRALCPSLDVRLLSQAINSPLPSDSRARLGRGRGSKGCPQSHCARQARALHASSSRMNQFSGQHDCAAPRVEHSPNTPSPPAKTDRGRSWNYWKPPGSQAGGWENPDGVPEAVPLRETSSQPVKTDTMGPWDKWKPKYPRHRYETKPDHVPKAVPLRKRPSPPARPYRPDISSTPIVAAHLVKPRADFPYDTNAAETRVIYEALRLLRGNREDSVKIRKLVKYLVEERGERPNIFLYEALVVANWDPATGSAGELSAILEEMRSLGIKPSASFYHAALRLLSIHPDYVTRNDILRQMKERDIPLEEEGKWSIALGLLRDGQTEMAMDYWDRMCKEGSEIPRWLLETFVYVLTMRGFVDDAVQLIQQRLDSAGGDLTAVALGTWLHLLDECSRDLHYESTKFIWDELVQSGTLNPSDGICLNILATAARHGDPALATAVIELLSARTTRLGTAHYEPLLESYTRAGDLENAFRVLCVVAKAKPVGLTAGRNATRPIFQLLKVAPERVDEAVSIIAKLSKERPVPAAAIAVPLEALAKTGTPMSKVFDTYRKIRDYPRYGDETAIFKALLEECHGAEDAAFVVSEMDRYSVRPHRAILDPLTRCFASDGNFDVAMLYFNELKRDKQGLTERTLMALLERCCRDKDPRVWQVLEEAERRGMQNPTPLLEKLREVPRP